MRTLAHITAVILIILGIVVILSGVALGATGIVRDLLGAANAVRAPRAGLTGLLVVFLIFTHGLLVIGAGEGLYLVAGLSGGA